ncbi:hypothetical protein ACFVRR_22475 [Gottfriedia sp. NPDC057948]|uniref:hypothetical protein n=1 Tax=Gottfriedia sp. NPDC057948 TaxID=3346287 RepID=UPI0036DAA7D8
MNIYVFPFSLVLLFSLGLLFSVGKTLYIAVKKYEEDGELPEWISGTSLYDLLIVVILFISEKFFPKRYRIVIFKIISLLFGVFLFGVTVFLLWYFYDQLFN